MNETEVEHVLDLNVLSTLWKRTKSLAWIVGRADHRIAFQQRILST